MTLPIHEAGGLTDAEIRLLIEQAKEVQVTTLDQKLSKHQDAIEKRLSVTDAAVKDNLDRTIELKTDVAVLMASDQRQTALLQTIVDSGEKWHEADLTYRSSMIDRVTAIETEQKRLASQVQMIRWFVATSAGITKTIGLGVKLLCQEEFWKIAGSGILLLVLSHFSPYLFHLLQQVLPH